jgi:hypothetical protein
VPFRGGDELANFFFEQRDPEAGQHLVDVSARQLTHRQVKRPMKLSDCGRHADRAHLVLRQTAWPDRLNA